MRRGRKKDLVSFNTPTPCVRICVFNDDDYCVGCKRSMIEIRDWHRYSEEMRTSITIDLIDRLLDV